MKKTLQIAILILAGCGIPAMAQTAGFTRWCEQGGVPAQTSGLPSSNKLLGIVPQCDVTVYLTGTLTKATIYSNASGGTLTNPFKATINGQWLFYAATGQGYDVQLSGGIPPLTYTTPVTLTDLINGSGGGSGPIVEVNGTPISPSSPANFVDTSSVTWAFVGGQIQATAMGGGSGGCSTGGIPTTNGSVIGDPSSTNCGTDNRIGDQGLNLPADVSTFGYSNLANNGLGQATVSGFSQGAWVFGNDVVLTGDSNVQGTSGSECNLNMAVVEGNNNLPVCYGTSFTDAVILGDQNLDYVSTSPNTYYGTQIVAIGVSNFDFGAAIPPGYTSPVRQNMNLAVAIGSGNGTNLGDNFDTTLIGDGNGQCNTSGQSVAYCTGGADIVGVGDTNANGMNNNSDLIVAIGASNYASPSQGASGPNTIAGQDIVAIGENNLNAGTGNEIVGIGDSTVGGLFLPISTPAGSTGSNLIGIGFYSLGVNTTGNENIGIGDSAGCVGCTLTAVGFGNRTGSNNIWIGNTAGPNTVTQVSNTIAIGYQSYNTASNQIVIGNSNDTSLIIFGSGNGCLSSSSGVITGSGSSCGSGGGGAAFSAITGSTNTTATMIVGTGATLSYAGSGVINATEIAGISVSGTPSIGSALIATSTSAATWQAAPVGTVTSITAGAGLAGGTITSSGTISIATGGVTNVMLANSSTTVNGQTCTLGSTCTISAGGSVTSVGLAMPSIFSVSGSPVTSTGTLTAALTNETADFVFAGPCGGSAASPTFRALCAGDLPLATTSAFGAVKPDNATILVSAGVISVGTIPYTSVSGLGTFATQNYATPPAIGGTIPAAGAFSSLTDTGAASSAGLNCLQINNVGVISNTGSVCGAGGGGTQLQVNGGAVLVTANLSNTIPAAGTGYQNVIWQNTGASVSAEVPYATGSVFGIIRPDGTTCSVTTGVLTCGGAATLWSAINNPTTSLSLTMLHYPTTFTFDATTGSGAMMTWQDTASNTGTGPIALFQTSSGSTALPWEALANGVGWKVGTNGALVSVGSTAHGITIPAGTAVAGSAGNFVLSSDPTNGNCEANENNTGLSRCITAANSASVVPWAVFSCSEVWSGSGASSALQSGDDAISNNTCYNDTGLTRTITAVKARSTAGSNTTTVNPTFGSAGTGTTICSAALTAGSSYAYSSSCTVSNASWTTGTGIDPGMATSSLTGSSIAVIVEYHY